MAEKRARKVAGGRSNGSNGTEAGRVGNWCVLVLCPGGGVGWEGYAQGSFAVGLLWAGSSGGR
jgi:hypothetical protein